MTSEKIFAFRISLLVHPYLRLMLSDWLNLSLIERVAAENLIVENLIHLYSMSVLRLLLLFVRLG